MYYDKINIGDKVRFISQSTGKTLFSGIIEQFPDPNDYPTCKIDGEYHSMADEGDSYDLEKVVDEDFHLGFVKGSKWMFDQLNKKPPIRNTDKRVAEYIKNVSEFNHWLRDLPQIHKNIIETMLLAYAEEVNRDVYGEGFKQGMIWAEGGYESEGYPTEEYYRGYQEGFNDGLGH